MPLRRLAVLGGTDAAARAEHLEASSRMGRVLAEHGIALLHQGAEHGPAGALAAAYRSAGGNTGAATPTDFAARAEGFIALPGGPAQLEELFGLCLGPSGSDDRPCGLLNAADYFTGLLKATDDSVVERFVRETQRGRLIVDRDPSELLRAMLDFRPPETRRQGP